MPGAPGQPGYHSGTAQEVAPHPFFLDTWQKAWGSPGLTPHSPLKSPHLGLKLSVDIWLGLP